MSEINFVEPTLIIEDVDKAVEFYIQALGAKIIKHFTFKNGKPFYTQLQVGESKISLCLPSHESENLEGKRSGNNPVSFLIHVNDVDLAFNHAKTAGMTVKHDIEDKPWGNRMGTLIDPFNVEWMFFKTIKKMADTEIQEAISENFEGE